MNFKTIRCPHCNHTLDIEVSYELKSTAAIAYYMRDNHTFKRLGPSIDEAMADVKAEMEAGYTYGMLCTKDRSDVGTVHAGKSWEEFEPRAREWLEKFFNVSD